MKKIATYFSLIMACVLFAGISGLAQQATGADTKKETDTGLKTYVIEREIPGAGQFSAEKLKEISKVSCVVLKEMGPDIQWMHSYVTNNKIYCVYKAKNIDLVREHAKRGGFPANSVQEVSTVISPDTAN